MNGFLFFLRLNNKFLYKTHLFLIFKQKNQIKILIFINIFNNKVIFLNNERIFYVFKL